MRAKMRSRREGMALGMVLVVLVVVSTVAAAASIMSASSYTMTMQEERLGVLSAVADAGLEQARAMINGDKSLYPDSLFNQLEDSVSVTDAAGNTIPGVVRSTYVGPTGITSGQYGVFGSIVTVVESPNGDRVVRREEVEQESFAKYAYFTDIDYSAGIVFGGGDELFGPVHSNDYIAIHWTGATFHGPVTTARTIVNQGYGTFLDQVTENALRIPMPVTADLNKLRNYATAGGTRIVGDTNGGSGQATTRIEFIAIDLDGDSLTSGPDEGFMRVYQSSNADWVTADVPSSGMRYSKNCGDIDSSHGGIFEAAYMHPGSGHSWQNALVAGTARCYLGGADSIFGGFVASDTVGPGAWLAWTGTVDPRLTALGRADAGYLWPLSRTLNPNFKGVVFVDGKVVISGTMRAKITLAATDNVIIGDDFRYVTDPSAGTCADIMGLFSGTDVVVADNTINAPINPYSGAGYQTYDDTSDEFINGVVLALSNFRVENYSSGSTSAEPCSTTTWGRGCLYLTGGIIQRTRGAVGQTNGHGYLKRYSYDQCAFSDPPPYFPTTGHFAQGRLFDIDPNGFDVAALYAMLTPII